MIHLYVGEKEMESPPRTPAEEWKKEKFKNFLYGAIVTFLFVFLAGVIITTPPYPFYVAGIAAVAWLCTSAIIMVRNQGRGLSNIDKLFLRSGYLLCIAISTLMTIVIARYAI